MAKPAAPDIDKGELKKLLIRSKKEPVNCAVAVAGDGSAVLMLDKIKQPRAVGKKMEEEYGDLKNVRWGTAEVDTDVNPKLVVISLNKAAPGIARKLKKTLKGTGFTKVSIKYDDGSAPEEEMDDDEDDVAAAAPSRAPAADEPAPDTSSAAPPAAPDSAAEPAPATGAELAATGDAAAAEGVDFKALTGQLSVLVRKMIGFVDDAAKFKSLRAMADKAQAAIKGGQDEAVELVYELDAAMQDGAPAPAATDAAAPASPSPQPPAAPPQPAPAAAESGIDFKALTTQLTDLVKKMIPVKSTDPDRFAQLKAMADKASAAIKASNDEAVELTHELAAAVDQGADAAASGPSAPAAPAAPPMDPAKHAALGASPKLWNDTVSSVGSSIDKLKEAIRKDFASEGPDVVADIEKNLDRISKITERFDSALADHLKAAHEATDDATRRASITKAKSVLADHIKYAASEPLIAMLDDNPFGVSTDIKKTLVTNLQQLVAAVR